MRKLAIAIFALVACATLLVYGPASIGVVKAWWGNELLINFGAAWIPFVVSVLLAFIPDHEMKPKTRIVWRASVILAGFFYSALLWHQQTLNAMSSQSTQQTILNQAIKQSNEHSDQSIKEVRKDVQSVKSDMQDVRGDISKSTSTLSESISKVKTVPDIAQVDFTFWPAAIKQWPMVEKHIPIENGAVNVDLTFMVKGHPAKALRVWLRLCDGCAYGKEPNGFQAVEGRTVLTERFLIVGDLPVGAAYSPVTKFSVISPFNNRGFVVALSYTCDNCAPVDPDHPQILTVIFDKSKQSS
jgi:hypothetical protein